MVSQGMRAAAFRSPPQPALRGSSRLPSRPRSFQRSHDAGASSAAVQAAVRSRRCASTAAASSTSALAGTVRLAVSGSILPSNRGAFVVPVASGSTASVASVVSVV
jgi:hypothetical protein